MSEQAGRARPVLRRFHPEQKTSVLNSKPISAPNAVPTVTLFIPALFWPHAGVDHDVPITPALGTLLGRGDCSEVLCDDDQAWLCGQFGVTRQADWPIAPIALLGAGMPPGDDFWLSADPVHLQVNRDQLLLLAPETLSITDAEAASLCAALNRHFAADHFIFVAPQPHRWYLKTAQPARIHTSSLSRVTGRNVDRMLPQGEDRLDWHRSFNEIQMVMHAHPVNEQREQRGALPINSLWFSGGGKLPHASTAFNSMIGSSALAHGLSKLAGIPFLATGQGIAAIGAKEVLVELDEAANAAMRLDPSAWKQALEDLEQRWVAPLAQRLRKGRIRELVIATVDNGRSYRWSISRMNLWRLWRSPASLARPARGSR
jgi:hypothetical protein